MDTDKTNNQIFTVVEIATIEMDDGHLVTPRILQKIYKHRIKETEKNTLYKIQGTRYFVMRDEQPA